MASKQTAFATKDLAGRAIKDSFKKLSPKDQIKNPVMFLVYLSAILTTILYFLSLAGIVSADDKMKENAEEKM